MTATPSVVRQDHAPEIIDFVAKYLYEGAPRSGTVSRQSGRRENRGALLRGLIAAHRPEPDQKGIGRATPPRGAQP
jgi:hypothetical protein